MLAYAAHRPTTVEHQPHPSTMLLIIGVHVALIAALMSAKMERVKPRAPDPPLIRVPLSLDPPPSRQTMTTRVLPHERVAPEPDPDKSLVKDHFVSIAPTGKNPLISDPSASGGVPVGPEEPYPTLRTDPTLPRLLTSEAELKPPYPAEKLLNEEEAVLTLKLAIDADGRVTSVEPVGKADAVFLNAARRHLIAHWRYAPATRDGRAVPSTLVVTLHFELNG